MLRTKVLVVGGGPAGSIAARTLAREGIDTVLIEKNLSFVKPCGGGVTSTVFSELQLPSGCVEKYIDVIKLVSPGGEILPIRLAGASIAIVNRGDFDASLRAEAGRCGARIQEAEFRSFTDIGKTVISEAVVDGERIAIEADCVIAADGVNSRVRAAMKMEPVSSFLTISEKIPEEETDCCEFWFGSSHAPRLYSWVFPQRGGVSAGTGCLEPNEVKEKWRVFVERRALKADVSGISGKGSSARGYRIPLWQGDLYESGSIFFVGDAAGQVLPLTYEGIYYSMRSGELVAQAVIEGKKGSYKSLWEKNFGKRFLLMKHLWKYFLKDDARAERLVQFHKRPDVQEASMRLWLRKDRERGRLRSYMNIFRRLFG